MSVYMKVTLDKYSLPVCVANSWAELAEMCGVKVNTIHSQRSHFKSGTIDKCAYIVVEVDDEND